MAPPHGILTRKMVVPPTLVSGEGVGIQQGGGEEWVVLLFEIKCWSVL